MRRWPLRTHGQTLGAAGLTAFDDNEIELSIVFDDSDSAERAFVGAGPTQLAIQNSGEQAVAQAVRDALAPFTGKDGRVTLSACYQVVLARA
jgi:hypothetical protein